jgi:hypothetical protein
MVADRHNLSDRWIFKLWSRLGPKRMRRHRTAL